ncbi:hypothetical protein BJ508DRAFT_79896 [Ascobolus immersus RN42]|uniref:Uncharacterized protein n=1 Tax=Ascobolus immersus RN42 TaxID=1160509 RepID=A0A3N4HIN6_ASCIM|nr:hypothetical protein BJ508DRAFT_79896 [Ascobolus immersus RN42]
MAPAGENIGELHAVVYEEHNYHRVNDPTTAGIRAGGGVSINVSDAGTIRLNASPSATMDKVELLFNEATGITEIAFASSTSGSCRTFTAERKYIGAIYKEGEDKPYTTVEDDFLGGWNSILQGWENIMVCLKDVLSQSGRNMRLANGEAPGDLLHGLSNAAEVADRLDRNFMDLSRALTGINYYAPQADSSEGESAAGSNNGSQTGSAARQSTKLRDDIIIRLGQIERFITMELVKKVETLFQRASNILSIDEASRAREQNSSIKRMSWITFIFLPGLFVTVRTSFATLGLYGMNIDILKDHPHWYSAFYFGIPILAFVLLGNRLLKYHRLINNVLPDTNATRRIIRWARNKWIWRWSRKFRKQSQPQELELPLYSAPRGFLDLSSATVLRRREEAILEAVRAGFVQTVRVQLSLEPKVDLDTPFGADLCNLAASLSDIRTLQCLVEFGADINSRATHKGDTAIFCAIKGSKRTRYQPLLRLDMVKELVRMGANLKARGKKERTVLMVAAKGGDTEIISFLLAVLKQDGKRLLTAHDCTPFRMTALDYAAASGVTACLDAILSVGKANPYSYEDPLLKSDRSGRLPVMYAVGSEKMVKHIFQRTRYTMLEAGPSPYRDADHTLRVMLDLAAERLWKPEKNPITGKSPLRSDPESINNTLGIIEFIVNKFKNKPDFAFLIRQLHTKAETHPCFLTLLAEFRYTLSPFDSEEHFQFSKRCLIILKIFFEKPFFDLSRPITCRWPQAVENRKDAQSVWIIRSRKYSWLNIVVTYEDRIFLRLLLECGANVVEELRNPNAIAMQQFLVNDRNGESFGFMSLLEYAIVSDQIKMVRMLLKEFDNPHFCVPVLVKKLASGSFSYRLMSPLNIALRYERAEIVALLLIEFKADYDYFAENSAPGYVFAPLPPKSPVYEVDRPSTLKEVGSIMSAHKAYKRIPVAQIAEELRDEEEIGRYWFFVAEYDFYCREPTHFSASMEHSSWYQSKISGMEELHFSSESANGAEDVPRTPFTLSSESGMFNIRVRFQSRVLSRARWDPALWDFEAPPLPRVYQSEFLPRDNIPPGDISMSGALSAQRDVTSTESASGHSQELNFMDVLARLGLLPDDRRSSHQTESNSSETAETTGSMGAANIEPNAEFELDDSEIVQAIRAPLPPSDSNSSAHVPTSATEVSGGLGIGSDEIQGQLDEVDQIRAESTTSDTTSALSWGIFSARSISNGDIGNNGNTSESIKGNEKRPSFHNPLDLLKKVHKFITPPGEKQQKQRTHVARKKQQKKPTLVAIRLNDIYAATS